MFTNIRTEISVPKLFVLVGTTMCETFTMKLNQYISHARAVIIYGSDMVFSAALHCLIIKRNKLTHLKQNALQITDIKWRGCFSINHTVTVIKAVSNQS